MIDQETVKRWTDLAELMAIGYTMSDFLLGDGNARRLYMLSLRSDKRVKLDGKVTNESLIAELENAKAGFGYMGIMLEKRISLANKINDLINQITGKE